MPLHLAKGFRQMPNQTSLYLRGNISITFFTINFCLPGSRGNISQTLDIKFKIRGFSAQILKFPVIEKLA